MVNPGAFQGSRLEFLRGEKPAYAAAVAGGYAADAVAIICARYFKRYPVSLAHNEEPTAEFLASVDDNAPEPEQEAPDADELGEEAYAEAVAVIEERCALIQFRKGQIKRWLAYQYMKDADLSSRESGAFNPYRVLLAHLTGQSTAKPRKKSALNVWRPSNRVAIEAEKQRRIEAADAAEQPIPKSDFLALSHAIADELFEALPSEDRIFWEEKAAEEHRVALAQWKQDNFGPISTKPEDRQRKVLQAKADSFTADSLRYRVIQGLVRFMQSVLDLVLEASGWPCSFIGGGPEPADNGRLNIIHVHAGATLGDVPMNFGRLERANFTKHIIPMFSRFLFKSFTPEMCKARALPDTEGHLSLSSIDDMFTESSSINAAVEPTAPLHQDALDQRVQHALALLQDMSRPLTTIDAAASVSQTVPSATAISTPPSTSHSNGGSMPITPIDGGGSRAPSQEPSPPCSPSPPSPSLPRQSSIQASIVPQAEGDPGPTGIVAQPSVEEVRVPQKRKAPAPVLLSGRRTRQCAAQEAAATKAPATRRSSRRVSKAADATGTAASRKKGGKVAQQTRVQLPRSPSPTPSNVVGPVNLSDPEFPNAPSWFLRARALFDAPELGAEWTALVNAYSMFERTYEYVGAARLKVISRPEIISEWIRVNRPGPEKWDRTATIDNIVAFEEDFRAWWAIIQPSWRVQEGEVVLDAMMGDWEVLRRPGPNGLVLVMAGLCFWGSYLHNRNESLRPFTDHVVDCSKVIGHLL